MAVQGCVMGAQSCDVRQDVLVIGRDVGFGCGQSRAVRRDGVLVRCDLCAVYGDGIHLVLDGSDVGGVCNDLVRICVSGCTFVVIAIDLFGVAQIAKHSVSGSDDSVRENMWVLHSALVVGVVCQWGQWCFSNVSSHSIHSTVLFRNFPKRKLF